MSESTDGPLAIDDILRPGDTHTHTHLPLCLNNAKTLFFQSRVRQGNRHNDRRRRQNGVRQSRKEEERGNSVNASVSFFRGNRISAETTHTLGERES